MIPLVGNLAVTLYDPDSSKGYIALHPRDTRDRNATINLVSISRFIHH